MNEKTTRIPKIPSWLLKHIYVFDDQDAYFGDIQEEYAAIQKCRGTAKAKLWIWFHAVAAIPRWG